MAAAASSSYTSGTGGHVPIMVAEVLLGLDVYNPAKKIFVDGTFGRGGHTRAILEAAPAAEVIGVDQDPSARAAAEAVAAEFPGRFTFIQGKFGDLAHLLAARPSASIHGVLLDIGVSSPQLDEAARGFSFMAEGPLDMRMSGEGETAADVVNTRSEAEIADIIYELGEERRSRAVAKAIVEARLEAPIQDTVRFAEIIRRVVRRDVSGIDPATRTFQALRLYVNDELGQLARGLDASGRLLAPEGRLAVLTFHSLEDRLVKTFLKEKSGRGGEGASRHEWVSAAAKVPAFFTGSLKAVQPSVREIQTNRRSRSAKLRVAIRTDVPWSLLEEKEAKHA